MTVIWEITKFLAFYLAFALTWTAGMIAIVILVSKGYL